MHLPHCCWLRHFRHGLRCNWFFWLWRRCVFRLDDRFRFNNRRVGNFRFWFRWWYWSRLRFWLRLNGGFWRLGFNRRRFF